MDKINIDFLFILKIFTIYIVFLLIMSFITIILVQIRKFVSQKEKEYEKENIGLQKVNIKKKKEG
jgi:hypothetical protein